MAHGADYRAYPHGSRSPLLALQRQIGNRAVGVLLARAPKPKTPPKPPPTPELADGTYAIVPGVGTIRLDSVQFGVDRRITSPSGQGGSREPATPAVVDIAVTSQHGDHSDKLFRAAFQTDDLGTVELRFVKGGRAYMTIRLQHATIVGYSVGGSSGDGNAKPMESWTLNGDKIEFETDQAGVAPPPG